MPQSPLHFIRQNAHIFAQVGSVVATYRTRGTARFGPYYRLIYRLDRRQHSLYIGRSEQLATQVRQLLHELQKPRDLRGAFRRSNRIRKATLLRLKREWQQVARAYGLQPHGWGVRGLRALGWPRIDKIHFRKKPPTPLLDPNLALQPAPAPNQNHTDAPVTPHRDNPNTAGTPHTSTPSPSRNPPKPHRNASSPTVPKPWRYCPTLPRAAQLAHTIIGSPKKAPFTPRYCPIRPRAAQLLCPTIRSRGPPPSPGTVPLRIKNVASMRIFGMHHHRTPVAEIVKPASRRGLSSAHALPLK